MMNVHFSNMNKRLNNVSCSSLPPKKRIRSVKNDADHNNKNRKNNDDDEERISPTDFIVDQFYRNGFTTKQVQTFAASQQINVVTREHVKHYTMEVTTAVRTNDLATLRHLYHNCGAVVDCCNQIGNSLVHVAARRGHTDIVKFLVEEANASVHFIDEYHRTPLHDACWTSTPNFEIVEILLRYAPAQALCRDNRGATPFDYARHEHHDQWVQFLRNHKSLLELGATKQQVQEQQ